MITQDSPFRRLLERFDPFDPECGDHFLEVADALREACPVAHSEAQGTFWTVTRFADVKNGFADNEGLSSVPTTTIPPNPGAVPVLPLQCEPDVHGGFRRLLDPFFRAGAIARYEEGIRRIVNELIDGFIERGQCEFIADFARPLPGAVIFQLFLGLPASELEAAYHWTMAIMHDLDKPDAHLIHQNFMELIAGLIARRRGEPRRPDVVDALLHGTVFERNLTDDEIFRTVMLLIAAGLDTTVHSLGIIMHRLSERPDLCEQLVAEPDLLPGAIEEFLRCKPPAGGLVRTASRDTVIGEEVIPAGDRVLLLVASANRDPREYDDPDELNFNRQGLNLTFGYGAHYCLGVHLARLELRVALGEILSRMKHIRLLDDGVPYDSGCSRGPKALHLSFDAAPGPA
jgi:cytochrome P450